MGEIIEPWVLESFIASKKSGKTTLIMGMPHLPGCCGIRPFSDGRCCSPSV